MKATIKRRLSSLGFGLTIGLLGLLIGLLPPTAGWEEAFGLGLLFKLRGQRPAPDSVAIVSINGDTGAQLGLGEEIPEWPRALHSQLIERLQRAGVAVIAFDIFFKKPRNPQQDEAFAAAIERAGNVLLVGYLERERMQTGGETLQVERLMPPAPRLAAAAAGVAPFVLPKVPVRVSRFWTFNGENALPSLPMQALQRLADPDGSRLRRLLAEAAGDPAEPNPDIRPVALLQRLQSEPGLSARLLRNLHTGSDPDAASLETASLHALLAAAGGEVYPYLNFYGPPSSLLTLPYQQLMQRTDAQLETLRGRVVFVGYVGDYQPKQRDGFYTVFSQDNGLDLSGVEIAATAFANLLRGETLQPLSPGGEAALLLLFGLTITLLLRRLPGLGGVAASLALALVYLAAVYMLFERQQIWLPWFVPLVLQMPLAMIGVLSWHYRQMRHSREQLRELFGYYLPGEVIDRLAEDKERAMEQSDRAFGICLASDARQYTSLAEQMEPEALQTFLNRYYEILFAPVRARGGVVSDVVGDAMLAIWPATQQDPSLRQKACEAALDIVDTLRASSLHPVLPTGIGLHAGELVMSHVGAIDHFEYRAVGDMVNTASRIEAMNKLLGTTILASEETLVGLHGILTRELGSFHLAGRRQPIVLHEIAALERDASPRQRELHRDFSEALSAWQAGEREQALARFEALHQSHPDDGPTVYYIQQYHERRSNRINPLA